MNLLLITFSFPPAGGVGVFRALSFAKYFPENGIRVDVLTARNAPSVGRDLALLDEVPKDVAVHRTWTLDLPFGLRKRIKRIVSGRAPEATTGDVTVAPKVRSHPLKRWIGNLLLPDPQVGWLPFALPAAIRIIRERQIDAVLITVPPFSSVRLIAMLRKAFPNLCLVLDFRDEWLATTIDLVSFNSNERARAVAQRAETEAVRDATAVVAVTDAARRELRLRYPSQPAAKFHWLPNGFESRPQPQAIPALASPNPDRVMLTYLGTVYGSTDPSTFVDAVLSLPATLRQRLLVRFIGHIETPALRASLERLGDTLELRGFLPRSEALAALDCTDYLLLISHDRINVSAKFYDYLSGTRPILAAVHGDGEIRRLIEETQAGYWADVADKDAIGAMLRRVLEATDTLEPLQPQKERIAQYDRRVLAARYARLLSGLATRDASSDSAST